MDCLLRLECAGEEINKGVSRVKGEWNIVLDHDRAVGVMEGGLYAGQEDVPETGPIVCICKSAILGPLETDSFSKLIGDWFRWHCGAVMYRQE